MVGYVHWGSATYNGAIGPASRTDVIEILVHEISVTSVTQPPFVEVSNWTWAPIGIFESVVAE